MLDEGKGGICNGVRRRGYCYGYKHHMPSLRITSYPSRTIGKYPLCKEGRRSGWHWGE